MAWFRRLGPGLAVRFLLWKQSLTGAIERRSGIAEMCIAARGLCNGQCHQLACEVFIVRSDGL